VPGLDVIIAPSGAEGLKALDRERPSLLILDINMPGENGIELARKIRKRPASKNVPVLILTGALSETSRLRLEKEFTHSLFGESEK